MTQRPRLVLAAFNCLTLATAMAACSDGARVGPGGDTRRVALLEALSDTLVEGVVGTAVTPAPRVRVTGADGRALPGAAVVFQPEHDGRVDVDIAVSDADGIASPGRWILGPTAGPQRLSASSGTVALTFQALASHGPVASVMRLEGDFQSGLASDTLARRLSVRISDDFGNAIAGEPVSFLVTAGGGSIDASPRFTDGDGAATSGAWILGAASEYQQVTVAAGLRVTVFTARACDGGCETLEFAFVRGGRLYHATSPGGNVSSIEQAASGHDDKPAWAPDGHRLAFVRYRQAPAPPMATSNWNAEVWTVDLTGGMAHFFMAGHTPAWSPDGLQMAISRGDCVYDCESFIVQVADTTRKVGLPALAAQPAWSPDGSRLAYVSLSGDDGYHALHVISADGKDQHELLSRTTRGISRPSWSPDGAQIAFTSCELGTCGLYTFRVDGSDGDEPRPLLISATVFDATWSPDGDWILCTTINSGEWSIVLVSVTQPGNPIQVIRDGLRPAWRPVASR